MGEPEKSSGHDRRGHLSVVLGRQLRLMLGTSKRDRAVRIHKNVKLVSTVAGRRDRRIDGGAEALDYLVHIVGTDNEGRREQHVVSAHAVGGAASRITHQSSRHGLALDAGVEFERGIERLLGLTVLDQFDSDVIYQQLAEINAVPASWMRDPAAIQQLREARAQQQQMQQMVDAAPAAAGVMKALN